MKRKCVSALGYSTDQKGMNVLSERGEAENPIPTLFCGRSWLLQNHLSGPITRIFSNSHSFSLEFGEFFYFFNY